MADGIIPKKDQKRSNSYPSSTVMESLGMAEFVYKNSGGTYIKGEDIAKLLNKSLGALSQKIGTCVQYGLLEVKPNVGYKASELLKRIIKPINSDEKIQSLREAFKNPKLYKDLISKFSGEPIPSAAILPNILERHHSIYEDAARKASQIFFQNLKELDLLDNNNQFSFEKAIDNEQNYSDNSETIPEETLSPEKSLINNVSDKVLNIDAPILGGLVKTEIPLTKGKKAFLFYPTDIDEKDIKLLTGQIKFIELFVQINNNTEE